MTEQHIPHTEDAMCNTIAFFDALDYPPTWTEVMAWREDGADARVDATPFEEHKQRLLRSGVIEEGDGRVALKGRLQPLLQLVRERTPLFPRKIRAARKVALWLARQNAVRFVALANTTALAHARHQGDLDFFVIVRAEHIWSSRLLGGAPYRLMGKLSGPNEQPDAVCLSYFIADDALDLSSHMLPQDDPYFRYWFLALLPLYDDGVSAAFWQANNAITARHPHAEPWMVSPDLGVSRPVFRVPSSQLTERIARAFQRRWFPASIRHRMNRDTSVIVNDHALKFHVDDGRARFREQYHERLRSLSL
jgi:hypothetical protein